MLLVIDSYQHMPSFLLKALLSDRFTPGRLRQTILVNNLL